MVNNRDCTLIENELLKCLLALPRAEAPDRELERAIRLLAQATCAATAYLELIDGEDPSPCVVEGHDVAGGDSAETICRGVIAQAMADRTLIRCPSARSDSRFRDLGSVRRNEIDAIVCAPFQVGDLVGAVCVQRRKRSDSFSDGEVCVIEYFVQQLMLVARRLVPLPPTPPVPLREELRRIQENLVREALARSKGNVAQAARELKVARSFVYSVVPNVERPARSGR